MRTEEFDYELPGELIAQEPASERASSRLLHVEPDAGLVSDWRFVDLPKLLGDGDMLVLNDTRVIKARLFAVKDSGGKVEILIARLLAPRRALALLRASHPPKPGQQLRLPHEERIRICARDGELFELEFEEDLLRLLDRAGRVPLPPYIEREARGFDEARYQTVFARVPGAVAAPTAGLHFDAPMLESVQRAGARLAWITLHVGTGTFQPVRTADIEAHEMHSEWYRVPEETVAAVEQTRREGGRILAIGTTVLRALESAAQSGHLRAGSAETRLFIRPGFGFRVVDRLLTNFHLPRSTLLMLVAAFAGLQTMRRAYRHAIEQRYRFFSYGDAMLIEKAGAYAA
jgi:S-adenosylmethionine:tRNA ribosyltransferase-isomerase